jgi:hypothetical protein
MGCGSSFPGEASTPGNKDGQPVQAGQAKRSLVMDKDQDGASRAGMARLTAAGQLAIARAWKSAAATCVPATHQLQPAVLKTTPRLTYWLR